MGWSIECGYPQCLQPSWASNIVELIGNFCDGDGLLVCPHCKKTSGYIRKKFNLQEEGETWEPILRGVIKLGNEGDTGLSRAVWRKADATALPKSPNKDRLFLPTLSSMCIALSAIGVVRP